MDLLLLSDNLFFRDGVHRLCPGGVSLLCKEIWALFDHSTPEIFGVADSGVCNSACIYLMQQRECPANYEIMNLLLLLDFLFPEAVVLNLGYPNVSLLCKARSLVFSKSSW